jgi:photosystem II stability/assembly factor-like uncharacterized protein
MRPHIARQILRWLVILPALLLLATTAPASSALGAQAPDWEPLGIGEAVVRLFTPASGAFFVQTASGLMRSDDGGTTWRAVDLPPQGPYQSRIVVAVDPNDHTILFANGAEGVYRSTDDGMIWEPLALPASTGSSVRSIAVSPADHAIVYVMRAESDTNAEELWLLRSDDGGTTWDRIRRYNAGPGCAYGVVLFQPHASDPDKVFYRGGCYRGEPNADSLSYSTNRGAVWTSLSSVYEGNTVRIVGGQGQNPGRFYLGSRKPNAHVAQVFRNETGVDPWLPILSVEGTDLGGLAYDPAAPDHVYAGTTQGTVLASTNAGRTWTTLGRSDLGAVRDLALGIDGANLYAATDQGVWRLALGG